MTKKPRKTKAVEPRDSYTIRNRAVIAFALLASLGAAILGPWGPADQRESKTAAVSAPPGVAVLAPSFVPTPPPVKPGPTPSPAFTTASVAPAATPLPPTAPQPSRMSPTLEADFDAWLVDAYKACYTPPSATPDGDPYLPRVRVALKADGTLAGSPRLVNPPLDPAWRAHAEAAIKAVKSCDPLHVPDKYAPYYSQWKTKTVFFDPTRS